jgi:ParB-like chromosome segregation protein Spo0J
VICGNQRLRAAKALGWDSIPCIFVDLDERRAREWMLRDNNSYGEWIEDDLAPFARSAPGRRL